MNGCVLDSFGSMETSGAVEDKRFHKIWEISNLIEQLLALQKAHF